MSRTCEVLYKQAIELEDATRQKHTKHQPKPTNRINTSLVDLVRELKARKARQIKS